MLRKFGTGTITTIAEGDEEALPPRTGRALTPEEWEEVVSETEPTEDEEK